MINLDAAGLIAQVLPVGLLILAVERRALGPVPVPENHFLRVIWFLKLAFLGLSAGAGATAVALCVGAVVVERAIDDWTTWVVGFGSYSVYLLVVVYLIQLTMRSYVTQPEE